MKTFLQQSILIAIFALINMFGFTQLRSDGTHSSVIDFSEPLNQLKSSDEMVNILHQIPVSIDIILDIAHDGSNLWISGAVNELEKTYIYKISPKDGSVIKKIASNGINYPTGLTLVGKSLFVTDGNNNMIYKLDTIFGDVITSFKGHTTDNSLNKSSTGLAWDGNYLWQTENFGGGNFHFFKTDTLGNLLGSYSQAQGTSGLTFAKNSLWSSDNMNDYIYEIDTSTFHIIQSLKTPGNTPNGLAFDGQYLWLSDADKDSIYQIDIGKNTSGINNLNLTNSSFLIYPNPVTDYISFKTDKNHIGSTYTIKDISGKQISDGEIKKEITSIDISHFPSGIYMLQIIGQEEDTQTFKLIKN